MHEDAQTTRRAVAGRDGARARVRRVTTGVLIGSVAVAGTIASYVANSATHKKTAQAQPAPAVAAPVKRTLAAVAVPATPAVPSVLAPGESAAAPIQAQPQAQPVQSSQPQAAAPVQAPVVTQQAPVAVSGGS